MKEEEKTKEEGTNGRLSKGATGWGKHCGIKFSDLKHTNMPCNALASLKGL